MRDYQFTDRAERDMRTAREWYKQYSPVLANLFLDAVRLVIDAAREHPGRFPEVYRGVRATRCHRFPYRVYFKATDERIVVLAVYHTARDAQGWNDPERE
jgi:plasmid stabilization system protein ParE